MLEVQKYLRSGKTPFDLYCDRLINYVDHEKLPLVLFNYSNHSPKTDPIVRECRGLVLEKGTWNVVGKPMTRFFNYGEHPEETAAFDWRNFGMWEKVDGTFVLLSPYKGDWIVSTRGTFGDHEVGGSGKTWEQLFWETAPHLSKASFSPDTCYVFELWTRHNAIIKRYSEPSVWLLYAYDLQEQREWTESVYYAEANRMKARTPLKFNFFDSIGHVRSFLSQVTKDEPDFEGVVLKDRNGIRMKVKTETYLELHKFFGNGAIYSPKRLVPLWLSGDFHEVLKRFPDVVQPLREVGARLDDECSNLYRLWTEAKAIKGQREFAQYILPRTQFSAILFDLRKRYQLSPDDVTFEVFQEAWSQWGDLLLKKCFKEAAA